MMKKFFILVILTIMAVSSCKFIIVEEAEVSVSLQAEKTSAQYGESVTYTAYVQTNVSTINYKWFVDDVEQVGETARQLSVSKRPQVATTYVIKVQAIGGSKVAEDKVELKVFARVTPTPTSTPTVIATPTVTPTPISTEVSKDDYLLSISLDNMTTGEMNSSFRIEETSFIRSSLTSKYVYGLIKVKNISSTKSYDFVKINYDYVDANGSILVTNYTYIDCTVARHPTDATLYTNTVSYPGDTGYFNLINSFASLDEIEGVKQIRINISGGNTNFLKITQGIRVSTSFDETNRTFSVDFNNTSSSATYQMSSPLLILTSGGKLFDWDYLSLSDSEKLMLPNENSTVTETLSTYNKKYGFVDGGFTIVDYDVPTTAAARLTFDIPIALLDEAESEDDKKLIITKERNEYIKMLEDKK